MRLKSLPKRIKVEVERAYENLTVGWRELLNRSGDALTRFTDSKVEAGKKYRYEVSAVDLTGNESARTAPVEATAQ